MLIALATASCGSIPEPTDIATPDSFAHPNAGPASVTPVSLDPVPARYGYLTLPVRGSADRGHSVYVLGGAVEVAVDSERASDDFCLDVPLAPGVTSVLEVVAQDSAGNSAEPVLLSIMQDPALAVWAAPQPPLTELTPGLAVNADQTPKEGGLSSLTDADPTTSVMLPQAVVWIDLGGRFNLASLDLTFPDSPGVGDDTFATEYRLLTSSAAQPSEPPSESASDWTVLYDVYPGSGLPAGDGGVDHFAPTAEARYVAVHLIENNKIDWLSSEDLRTSELRVTGRDAEPQPAEPQTPTCANGWSL